MRPTFTILVATTGRYTLTRTLDSIVGQLYPGDEVLCVCGPPYKHAKEMFQESMLPGRFVELPWRGGDWGHWERNATMHLARTTHLMHIDDDDRYVSDALKIVRKAVTLNPTVPHIFRFEDNGGLWPDEFRKNGKLIAVGNVGTPCIVHPVNLRAKFKPYRGGDGHFIVDTCKQSKLEPIIHNDVIVLVRNKGIEN